MLGESEGISEEITSADSSNVDAQAEIGEIRDFIFDDDQVINVEALEEFVKGQQEQLI